MGLKGDNQYKCNMGVQMQLLENAGTISMKKSDKIKSEKIQAIRQPPNMYITISKAW